VPRVIDDCGEGAIDLEELVDRLETGRFDPDDEDSVAAFAPDLASLGRNRRFLADFVVEELKQSCAGQNARNQYGAQVILLHGSPNRFLVRANFWPSAEDSVVVNSGADPFFYGVPHDHNFSFLTVGYLGPGYWSDYYEYEYNQVVGHPGEPVDLKFVERSRLSEGKVMLYRRHRDIHAQLLPDSLSVSLNVLAVSPTSEFRDQYRFDLERREVASIINPSGLATLVRLAGHFGGDEGRELVDRFASTHPSERIRFAAIQAQAGCAGGVDQRLEVYERAASGGGAYVEAMARREVQRIRAARAWIERPVAEVQAAA
jgi:hypothetical protein